MGKDRIGKVFMMGLVLTLISGVSSAQMGMGRGGGGWGVRGQYQRMFNPATIETIKGDVTTVQTVTPSRGMSKGVHVDVKTEVGTIPVHLGPSWYLDKQDRSVKIGDKVEVTGSRVTFQGKPAIIASELKLNDEVLILRDKNGIPAWSGWRR
jgi:hypothetical protein